MAIRSSNDGRYPDSPNRNSIDDGLRFQDFVIRVCAAHGIIIQQYVSAYAQLEWGESVGGYEIKYDARCTDTGRLSIEIAEKSRADLPEFTRSGIYSRQQPDFYIQGNFTVFYMFHCQVLREEHVYRVRRAGTGPWEWREMPTIRTFYMPLQDADRLCIKKFIVRPDGQFRLFENRRAA